jgi:hypothetical protein
MKITTSKQIHDLDINTLSFVPFGVKPLPYPKTSGVYFLKNGITIVYIGKAVNLYNRLMGHERRYQFKAQKCLISWIELDPKKIDFAEGALIERFKPEINFSPNGKTNSNWELNNLINDKGWDDKHLLEARDNLALTEYKLNIESFKNGTHPALPYLK